MRLSFEGFAVDLEAGQLILAGNPVALERRAFEMLAYLAAHPNRLVSKDELLSEVWHARALSEGAVMNAATKLRKAFGQAPGASEPIETLRGRGYRLHASPLRVDTPKVRADSDPFVGRAQALALLDQTLERAQAGQGQLVLLTGEPGIGKTRTLDELGKRARARGFSVWEGAAYDGGGAPAYWPWIQILRAAHADLSRSMFRQHVVAGSGALARLVPELLDA
jgi:DNA-binding winged helix-turn-helix (wHTH) protein